MSFILVLEFIADVFKVNVRKIVLALILSVICLGGVIQSYVFIEESGISKPPLYDEIKLFNFWVPWIIFTAPIHILGYMLNIYSLIEFFPGLNGGLKFPLVSIAYAYLVSSLTVTSYDRWLKDTPFRRLPLILGAVLSVMLNPPFTTTLSLEPLVFSLSGFIFLTLIFTVLIISTYGILRIIKSLKFKSEES